VPSLTLDEWPPLVAPCEAAFQAHRAAGRLAGQPRPARRFTVDNPGPLPPPADRLWFRLADVQTYRLQGGPGRLGGLGQRQAQPGRPGLRPGLLAALRRLGDAPARARTARAPRLGGSAAAAATGGGPRAAAAALVAPPAPPLCP
jgi:hypothetical protein